MQDNQTKQPIEKHKKYKTRDGRPVKIICTDRKYVLPVVALVTNRDGHRVLTCYSSKGESFDCMFSDLLELVEVQPWEDFKIDDPVLVSDDEVSWEKRHFAGINEEGMPLAFQDGCTSWSSSEDPHGWNFCKKPEQE